MRPFPPSSLARAAVVTPLLLGAGLLASGCGSTSTAASTTTTASTASGGGAYGYSSSARATTSSTTVSATASRVAAVTTRNGALGTFLTDGRGRTLYLFEADHGGKSACTGQCATFWPPLTTTGRPTAHGAAKASRLGTITRADGKRQVTYGGHPLYRFLQDAKPGQTTGQGSQAFGAGWFVVAPSGKAIRGS